MDYAHRQTDRELSKLTRDIRAAYAKASGEMEDKLSAFLDDYAIMLDEQKVLLKQGAITEDIFNQWLNTMAADRQWLESMVDSLATDAVNADILAADMINGYLPGVYAENHNYLAYKIEQHTGRDIFTFVDKATARVLLHDNTDILKPNIDIPKDQRWNQKHIRQAITQSILQGESIPEAAERLGHAVDMDENAAVRNARTAITSAENCGRNDSITEALSLGIDCKKEWVAALDSRTRNSHRIADGEIVDVDDTFSNGCRYPGDPDAPGREIYNCRCTLVAAFDDNDEADRKTNRMVGSYAEWKTMKGWM